MITYSDVRNDEEVKAIMYMAESQIEALGFTEHSVRHSSIVSKWAGEILEQIGADEHRVELARIAGFLHDIGNSINRHDHAHSGAALAYQILKELKMPLEDILVIVTAIGHHDEDTGAAVDEVSAALILADKTDVRRNRVQNPVPANFDIHDRVNYAALSSALTIDKEKRVIRMEIELDDTMCTVMDYFEIFLQRMIMCRRAAERLGCKYKLVANGSKLC